MPNGRNIIPRFDLPPEDAAWARGVEGDTSSVADSVESLKTNAVADFKQVNASTTASMNQVARVRNYIKSIPSTDARSFRASIALPANTWTRVIDQEILIPAGKNKFTIASTMTIGLNTGSQNPSMWFSFFGGVGPSMESPMNSSTVSPEGQASYFMKMAHATNSASYTFQGNTGGVARLTLSLWSASAITTTGEASITYNLIAGGQA